MTAIPDAVAVTANGSIRPDPARRRFGRRRRRRPYISLAILALFVFLAVFGPVIVGNGDTSFSLLGRLKPPIGFGGSWSHALGTDKLGRDILDRLIVGARDSLIVATIAVACAGLLGLSLGVIAGYFGGWRDSVISRLVDVSLAFPVVLLALLFAVEYGPSLWNVVIVIILLLWARFARLVRGEALSLRDREFVEASIAMGATPRSILFRHIVPNVLGPVLILATLEFGWAILAEASLSFLGAGIPPPTPAWGSMVADGQDNIATAWWISTIPGIAIAIVIVAFNLVGDWLRDVMDPGQAT